MCTVSVSSFVSIDLVSLVVIGDFFSSGSVIAGGGGGISIVGSFFEIIGTSIFGDGKTTFDCGQTLHRKKTDNLIKITYFTI